MTKGFIDIIIPYFDKNKKTGGKTRRLFGKKERLSNPCFQRAHTPNK